MKKAFTITDKILITETLNTAEYGVLALGGDKPYAIPVNFVYVDDSVYFHSSPKGKKMGLIRSNNHVSFNVTVEATVIPSYFSKADGIACPASAFFKSIIIDGEAEIIDSRKELEKVFTAMMEKLQPEGKYKSFDSSEYDKRFSVLSLVRIHVQEISAKFKFGQNLNQHRFRMIIKHLEKRGREIDLLTVSAMKQFYGK